MGIKQARGGEGCFLGSIARGSNTIAAAATRNHRVEPKRRVITRRKTRRSLGGLAFAAAELEQGKGVVSEFFTLSRGLKVETLEKRCATTGDSSKPNLLFLHGSYHGSWCWAVHYFDYFNAKGYNTFALSFLGQGRSDIPQGERVSGTVESHAKDVVEYLNSLQEPTVVVAHSFAGLILQRVMQSKPENVLGAAFLCSVPPTGNSAMAGRFLRRTPIAALKLVYAFISRNFETDETVLREIFFSEDIPDEELRRYQQLIKGSCKLPLLDLRRYQDELPIRQTESSCKPALVLGCSDDKVVDTTAVRELADEFQTEAVILGGIGHDCMLDTRWEVAADQLRTFLVEAF